jgi:pullulanase
MGIPFIHAGEEFLREKLDESGKRIENSYNSSDFVNKIRWTELAKADVADNIDYYRGLIAFRKAHAALRLSTAEEVAKNVTYKWITNEVVLFEVGEDIRVIFNATEKAFVVPVESDVNWNVCVNDQAAGVKPLAVIKDGKAEVAPISAMVLVKA